MALESRLHHPLRERHADAVRETLAQRAGRRLDAGRMAVLGMAGGLRTPLAKPLQLLHREIEFEKMEERIKQHRRVPGGEHEPVAIRPQRIARIESHVLRPEHVRHIRGAHGSAGVSRFRLLDGVGRQELDGVDAQLGLIDGSGGHAHLGFRLISGTGSGSGVTITADRDSSLPPRPWERDMPRCSCRAVVLAPAALLAVLALALGGCATNPATGKRQISLVSTSKELEIGRKSDPAVAAEYGLYGDSTVQRYVDSVGQRLGSISHLPTLGWHFRVLDSPVVNAFAIPGGYIYITRGILAYLNSEAQLAGVLGHEIGHVTARHSAQQITRSQIAGVGLLVGTVFVGALR